VRLNKYLIAGELPDPEHSRRK